MRLALVKEQDGGGDAATPGCFRANLATPTWIASGPDLPTQLA